MTEQQIKHLVDRFLSWSLPENFAPDAGIEYVRPDYPASYPGPSGTNLLDATQAEAMVRYMIDGMPAPKTEAMMEPGFNTPQTSIDAKDAMMLLAQNSRTAESAAGFAQAAGLFAIAAAIEGLEMTMRGKL